MTFSIDQAANRFAQLVRDGEIQVPPASDTPDTAWIREIAERIGAPEHLVAVWIAKLQPLP